MLVTHAGELLAREQLVDALWPDTFVSDNALYQALLKARQALGDSARHPRQRGPRGARGSCPVRTAGPTTAPAWCALRPQRAASRWTSWAELLRHVFDADALRCPQGLPTCAR